MIYRTNDAAWPGRWCLRSGPGESDSKLTTRRKLRDTCRPRRHAASKCDDRGGRHVAARESYGMTAAYEMTHLERLEAEAVHIIREVAATIEKPALLFSGGKDSV